MRSSVVAAALAAAFALLPVTALYAPASSQDFSITNQPEPADAGRRDVMRQLQAWWDVHAYYPRQASQNDEGGTVKVHLLIYPDGRIWRVRVVESSGSSSLDLAGAAAFRDGFVRPFPAGVPDADIDIPLHFVLAHRHDQPVAAGYTSVPSRSPFTITNDPVKSPILETMLQRSCTGTVVKQGIRNHPDYGTSYNAQAVFFRRPDGTPWVQFVEGGYPILSPVTEVGKVLQWTGREEYLAQGTTRFTGYTVWPDADNKIIGNIEITYAAQAKGLQDINRGGTVDLACATQIVPAITWSAVSVTPGTSPLGDPPAR